MPCTEHNMENGVCTWCGMAIAYTIAYDLAGGTVATPNPTTYTALSDAITLVNPTREGYVFTGWTGTGLTEPTMTVTTFGHTTVPSHLAVGRMKKQPRPRPFLFKCKSGA